MDEMGIVGEEFEPENVKPEYVKDIKPLITAGNIYIVKCRVGVTFRESDPHKITTFSLTFFLSNI